MCSPPAVPPSAGILERVADLFAAGSRGYSSQQIALFDDVLQKLCADIEVKARARLARRFADIDNAPPHLAARIASIERSMTAPPASNANGSRLP